MAKKQGPTQQDIAEAAYHRYLKRGGRDGGAFDDWIEAERELAQSIAKAQSPRPKAAHIGPPAQRPRPRASARGKTPKP